MNEVADIPVDLLGYKDCHPKLENNNTHYYEDTTRFALGYNDGAKSLNTSNMRGPPDKRRSSCCFDSPQSRSRTVMSTLHKQTRRHSTCAAIGVGGDSTIVPVDRWGCHLDWTPNCNKPKLCNRWNEKQDVAPKRRRSIQNGLTNINNINISSDNKGDLGYEPVETKLPVIQRSKRVKATLRERRGSLSDIPILDRWQSEITSNTIDANILGSAKSCEPRKRNSNNINRRRNSLSCGVVRNSINQCFVGKVIEFDNTFMINGEKKSSSSGATENSRRDTTNAFSQPKTRRSRRASMTEFNSHYCNKSNLNTSITAAGDRCTSEQKVVITTTTTIALLADIDNKPPPSTRFDRWDETRKNNRRRKILRSNSSETNPAA